LERKGRKQFYRTAFGTGLVSIRGRLIQLEADTHPRENVNRLTISGANGRTAGGVRNRRGPSDGRARIRRMTGSENANMIRRDPANKKVLFWKNAPKHKLWINDICGFCETSRNKRGNMIFTVYKAGKGY